MMRQFVSNGRILSLIIILMIVAGLGALSTLPRAEDPRITNRVASVVTYFPGASAERAEALVSEKVENKLRKLSEIKLITSTSRPGISVVRIELKDSITDTTPIWSRVRDLINDVAPELPPGVIAPTLDDDHGYAFTTLIALKWQGPGELDAAVLGRYAEALQNRILTVPGTDFTELHGEPEEEILVQLDPDLAGHLQLAPAAIAQRIGQADAKVSAGQLINDNNQLQVELTGALDSIDRIRRIPLLTDSNGFVLRLEDLAEVSHKLKWPASEIAIVDGQHAVVVAARMLPERRIDQWSTDVRDILTQFQTELPSNISTEVLFDQDSYTATRLGELVDNVLVGFALIAIVLFFTLGWRSALVVTAALPLTVLFTLSCMKYFGLPIHQMSVTGLVVALGIMVDNAIVMADSIQQRRQQGEQAIQAVMSSLHHLWLPLLGSTLTTVLAFMPIVLMPGPAGEFVGGIALSVIFSLIGSYIISHTLVAALSGRFLSRLSGRGSWYQSGIQGRWISSLFRKSLNLSLRFPLLSLILVFAMPLAGFISAGKLTEQFFPPSDRDMFQIELYLPAQSSILQTQRMTEALDEVLEQETDIQHIRWFIGNNAPSFYYNLVPNQRGAQNYAQGMITASDFAAANRMIPQLQQKLDDSFPQAQILVRKLEQGPPFNAPIELRFYGPNLDTLKTLGVQARQILAETSEVIHTRATLQPGTPKVWLNINEDASRISGLSLTEISAQLQQNLQGVTQGTIIQTTESIPVRVRVGNDQRQDLADLTDLSISVPGTDGNIPLSALATAELRPSRGAIPRRNGERVNVIEGYIRSGVLPATVLKRYQEKLAQAEFILPAGYRMEIGGESAKRNDAVGNLLASIGVIASLLVTVVVLSFNSFRMSILIFLAAFQSVGLGLLSVYAFSYPFGFTVIIGLLGLMGLAINAAIVILAELKADAKAIHGDNEAIVNAVMSCGRHISSTTITTVGGFLPLIMAGGGFWPPFAVAIAGGTVLTTLLSFYFVPPAFRLMSKRRSFELSNAGKEDTTHQIDLDKTIESIVKKPATVQAQKIGKQIITS
ncbi:efflux RND transporter permease subunit [Oceanospirillum sediminis]|uniref:Efflux RND transporter permease subunit n=1 Tax=Oceanospirillum sediminis TaxID=2760088 RepID=A0A839IXQ9_9GAMM|nr:efflux RND transporter permease subunit [Oceanospirillum sediminis]MBB1489612.1 efflux RND transporter permease subunit [Oceanospirillum sediminis]